MLKRTRPFKPEPIESMKARFPEAIKEPMTDARDPRIMEDCHWFDFDDGYRLHVVRDRGAEGDKISVMGGLYFPEFKPLTLLVARVGINFAEITDHKYGNGEVVSVDCGVVFIAFDFKE
jgi:hypothetical protein